jgi:hypothetical protein
MINSLEGFDMYSGYYDLHYDGHDWVAFDPYKSIPNYNNWYWDMLCFCKSRKDCIAQAEAMGHTWEGA